MRLWTKREDSIHHAVNTVTTATLFQTRERLEPKGDQDARVNGIPVPLPVKHQPWPAESGASRRLTGTFPIFPHHSRGPVVCTAVPSLSTATVTGMSLTSNS